MITIICIPKLKIEFERTGGFAGIRINTIIDTDNLSKEDKEQIQYLINESKFFDLKSDLPNKGIDYFKYKINITDDNKSHTIETTDITMDQKLRELVHYLKNVIENQNEKYHN